MRRLNQSTLALLFICILILSAACGSDDNSAIPSKDADLLEEVWGIIHEDYVDNASVTDEQLISGALRGMVDSLDDPYSSYFDPEQNRELQQQLEGEYGGIGATLTMKNDQLIVVSPMPGSPAEKAGIISGDKVLEVDGKLVSKMNLSEAAFNIRGEKGTTVNLLVLHPEETVPLKIEIKRDNIELESVLWEILPGAIAHLIITDFADNTEAELADALDTIISEEKAGGIILDLRDNPGGLITSAVNVMDKFIEEGLVVYALNNKEQRTEWSVRHRGIAQEIPLVVLVNGNSASASEIVAGAMQDHDRAPIIGTQTFGKGVAQVIRHLSNEGSIKITYSRWFTPNGRQIDGQGITPDIVVETMAEGDQNENDPQLERAISYLEETM